MLGFAAFAQAAVTFSETSRTLYIDNGTLRVGVDKQWGGAIRELWYQGENLVNNYDGGRMIGASLYDAASPVSGNPGDPNWGWNATPSDKYNNTNTILDYKFDASRERLYVKARYIQWNPSNKGGGYGRPVASDIIVETYISFLKKYSAGIKVRHVVTHEGNDWHYLNSQEFPFVYVRKQFNTFVVYKGDSPWTYDTVAMKTPSSYPPFEQVTAPEQWAAFVNSSGVGLTLWAPQAYPFFHYTYFSGGTGENPTMYMVPFNPFSIGPNQKIVTKYYLFVGKWQDARERIYAMRNNVVGEGAYPWGMLDAPKKGDVLAGTFKIRGWVVDDKGIESVDVYVDDRYVGRAYYGVSRQDVADAWPGLPNAPNYGFRLTLNSANFSNGTHTIKIVVRDVEGRESVLLPIEVTFNNPDSDNDGYPDAMDCDDADASVHPNAEEQCGDNKDNDCDNRIDEGCAVLPNRVIIMPGDADTYSIYSPDVLHNPGWDRYRMYYGVNKKPSAQAGLSCDQIYLAEHFGDGISQQGWSFKQIVLATGRNKAGSYDGSVSSTYTGGDEGCVHDPSVVQVRSNEWHMYYTGFSGSSTDKGNKIFHATSTDGVHWVKQGVIQGFDQSADDKFGFGHPSVLYEDGVFRLYFFSDTDPRGWSIFVATSTDGHNFSQPIYLGINGMNPDIKKHNGIYYLTYNAPEAGGNHHYQAIYTIPSTRWDNFDESKRVLLLKRSSNSQDWDSWHIGTPSLLPSERRLYYFGNRYVGQWHDMEQGAIGVAYPIEIPTFDTNAGEPPVPTNKPPKAEIMSISPNPASEGEQIVFNGFASDEDGYIAEYEWKLDGVLVSRSSSFAKSDIAAGEYLVEFRAKDDDGAWSEPVYATLTINATSQIQTVNIKLVRGLNMISPGNLRVSVHDMFADNPQCGLFRGWVFSYDAKLRRYVRSTELEPLRGYFVWSRNSCELELRGIPQVTPIILYRGWNLVSVAEEGQSFVELGPGCLPKLLMYRGGNSYRYVFARPFQPLDPTKGYWAYISANKCTYGE
jgi:hypothetical protein